MATSKTGQAHKYVDTAHRASLLYAFAALLLAHFTSLNRFSSRTNVALVFAPLLFFSLSIATYLIHGVLEDTTNQITKPRLGRQFLPSWFTPLFMVALTIAEIGGFLGLFVGFIETAYF